MEALVLWAATHPEEIKKWSKNLRRQVKRMWEGYESEFPPDWDMEIVDDVVLVSSAITTIEVVQ
jgi:hypothetical protein